MQDKLKSYDAQADVVLNAFAQLLLAVTKHQLSDIASFNETGTQFTLNTAPAAGIPIGDYFFESAPCKSAHQYRYSSDLCQWIMSEAKSCSTPDAALTFSLSKSDRATTLAKKLKGKGSSIAIELATFDMSTGKQNLAESHLLMIGRTDSGEELDHEQIKDLFDLACIDASETQIATNLFKPELDALHAELGGEVVSEMLPISCSRKQSLMLNDGISKPPTLQKSKNLRAKKTVQRSRHARPQTQ